MSSIIGPGAETPYSYQGSFGVQRQLGATMSLSVDYTYTGSRNEAVARNYNLTYNPATGANYPFTDFAHAVAPDWSTISASEALLSVLSARWTVARA